MTDQTENTRYKSFNAFFPFYLTQHAKKATRLWHYVGTCLVIGFLAAALISGRNIFYAFMPLGGYGFAWMAHAFIERNKPATFTYPLWSLMGDFKMFLLAITGQLTPHLEAAGIDPTK